MKSFDTKDCNDLEVSSRKFRKWMSQAMEFSKFRVETLKVSSRKFPRTPKFRAEGLKVSSRRFHQMIR